MWFVWRSSYRRRDTSTKWNMDTRKIMLLLKRILNVWLFSISRHEMLFDLDQSSNLKAWDVLKFSWFWILHLFSARIWSVLFHSERLRNYWFYIYIKLFRKVVLWRRSSHIENCKSIKGSRNRLYYRWSLKEYFFHRVRSFWLWIFICKLVLAF